MATASQLSCSVTRAEIEDFLYHEAALLDEWRLDEWLALLTEDSSYYVPPNDCPEGDHRTTLFLVADDAERIRQRVLRIMDPNCHAEFPHSRIRHHISNVRILGEGDGIICVAANLICHRFRRFERVREYVGTTRHLLRREETGFRIKERRVILDSHELGSLGSISFIL